MNSQGLFTFLRNWMISVIPTLVVIRSHQNAPAPEGDYVSIEEGSWLPIGHASKMVEDVAQVNPKIFDYSVSIVLWEDANRNPNILTLTEALEDQDAIDTFKASGVSVLSVGAIQELPRLQDKDWKRERRVELSMSVCRGHAGDNNKIESVEINDTLIGG